MGFFDNSVPFKDAQINLVKVSLKTSRYWLIGKVEYSPKISNIISFSFGVNFFVSKFLIILKPENFELFNG